jgi:glycine/betaine/sarcosine/D-proline reductase family selenoprotein B
VIVKEFERVNIPTAHICPVTPVAVTVGSNRIIPGIGIMHPVGNPKLSPEEEKKLRRALIDKAVEALQEELKEQKVF